MLSLSAVQGSLLHVHHTYMHISGQQTSQNSFHAAPSLRGSGAGPSLSRAQQPPPPGHRQTPVNFYSTSTSSSSGGAGISSSSSAGGQRRGKGRMVGRYYNEEGHPRSKKARMSGMVDDDDDDGAEHGEGKGSGGRANPFITAKDQHVSCMKAVGLIFDHLI